MTLTVKFLPGVPEKFHKSFQLQVAHFEPDTVNLLGEGVFPRISLDLPRQQDPEGQYESFMKEVREQLTTETKRSAKRPTSGVSQQGEVHNVNLQVRFLYRGGNWWEFWIAEGCKCIVS